MLKNLFFIGLFAMVFLTFSACGDGEDSKGQNGSSSSSTISSSSSSSEGGDTNTSCPGFTMNEENCYLGYITLDDNEKACCDAWLKTQK